MPGLLPQLNGAASNVKDTALEMWSGARGRWRCCYGLTGNMMMMMMTALEMAM
jgi:hypothetical protein